MPRRPPVQSFVVRVYRFDPIHGDKANGIVEAIDGTGKSTAFTDASEIGEIVCSLLERSDGRRPCARNRDKDPRKETS